MQCLFIGGALDGGLREVPRDEGQEYRDYHIANGIARHESVSEEEVARLVRRWMLACTRKESNPGGITRADWERLP
jgi:hypothetical protein